MRIKNLWRITNNSKESIWVWVFKSEDTNYWIEVEGKKFKLDSKETKETDIRATNVKIGFRKDSTVLAGWVAKPVPVATDRDVVLNDDKTISFQDTPMFDPVNKAKDVQFISEAQANNMARQAIVWGLGKIPKAGGIISSIVGFLWKEQKPKIDDLIEESEKRMKSWVRGQIDQLQRDNLQNFAAGLLNIMEEYILAKDPSTQLYWLRDNISHFDGSMPFFTSKKYVPGTVDIGMKIATIHIGLLRERVVFADKLKIPEVDRPGHIKKLEETIDAYQSFVLNIAIPAEKKWRAKAIEITDKIGLASYKGYYLRDTVVRQTYFYSDVIRGSSRNTSNSYVCKNYYLRQAKNSYANALTSNIADTASMWTLLKASPETLQPIKLNRVTWVGPCTGLLYKNGNEHGAEETVKMKTQGKISEIIVRAHNEVDYIKVIYSNGKSAAIGNVKGGTPYSVKLNEGVHITKVETWWEWELVAIRFHLSDGTTSAQFGNKQGSGRYHQVATMDNHILSGIQAEGHKKSTIGNALSFGFSPRPDFYELKV